MNQGLKKLLNLESQEISDAFAKASVEGENTPQEVADRREEVLSAYLRKYFPFPYRIVKGNVIDSEGRRSNSIDCLILSPSHPYTVDPRNNRASIIFADGVDYAIEIKPVLNSESEIERALKQIRSIKQLIRKRTGFFSAKVKSEMAVKNAHRIPGIIFSNDTYKDPRRLVSCLVDYYVKESVPSIEQFDLLVVNNRMLVFNYKPQSYIANGMFRGVAYKEYDEDTFMMFLLYLNRMPRTEMEMNTNILSIYLDGMNLDPGKTFEDLNNKLIKIDEKA